MINSDVTVVITSCGRQDLLEKTIGFFLLFNDYPIKEYIITEDSGNQNANSHLKIKYNNLPITWIEESKNRGQINCIDDAYSRVKTKYVFHCEDDWEFYKSGFIQASKSILEHCPPILQVWLRSENDTNGHPVDEPRFRIISEHEEIVYSTMSFDYLNIWSGFSFNPGLRRLHDYRVIGGYAIYGSEARISIEYRSRRYSAAIIRGNGYVRHLGYGRHIF